MRQHLGNKTSVYNLGTRSASKQHLSVRRDVIQSKGLDLVLHINSYSVLAGNEMNQHLMSTILTYNPATRLARNFRKQLS